MDRPVLLVHFPGCGGASVHELAKQVAGAERTSWNVGCSAEQASWRRILLAPRPRCNCSTLESVQRASGPWARQVAAPQLFMSNENPVMAPLYCHELVNYWVVLRAPVERILSRLHKSYPSNSHQILPSMTLAQAEAAVDSELRPARGELARKEQ